ncbi:MAG TPA: sodium:glutamate symporter [Acholeplasmatales bacterium]|nr:sodium:glutamate symporter [Acholeplasmatales bacterium]
MEIWNNFWEFDITVTDMMIQLGILMVLFLLANAIRRKVGLVRKSLIPTSMIAGVLILLLKIVPYFRDLISNGFMEVITYHALALGSIALALKSAPKDKSGMKNRDIMNAGLITVNTYLIQGVLGGLITVGLAVTFMSGLLPASGLILPLGFGQGSGQALSWGTIYETEWNFAGGASFGLTVAAIGFLIACVFGLIHINIQKRKGKIQRQDASLSLVTSEEISSPNDVPLTESVDRFSIQIALILIVYFLTFLAIYGVVSLNGGNFVANTVKPMIVGFNFLIGTILAIILKQIFKGLKKVNLMSHDYPNNYLLNRISGFCFDMMIVAGVGAIEISVLKGLLIPLVLICAVGTAVTYVYVRKTTKYAFPGYTEEAFVSLFGMLTGTNSTGIILLREIDPKFETPAANNLILQSAYAIAFGWPIFLLLGYAPIGLKETLITLGALTIFFLVFNAFLYRGKIASKLKNQKPNEP